MIDVKPIGVIHSGLKNLLDCPLQENENAPEAIIEIFKEYAEAAEHIKPGDKIVLLTWLNKANRSVLKTYPRNDMKALLTGVFSTRSPDRPNPIGLHLVEVTAIDTAKRQLVISSLEVLDGTPVIDIKSR
jgi:tRNA-Thr(GGU) m(6)t(6)A37 methyltransferase TsaA